MLTAQSKWDEAAEHYRRTECLNLTLGDTRAVLRGQTFDGTRICGTDTIRVVK